MRMTNWRSSQRVIVDGDFPPEPWPSSSVTLEPIVPSDWETRPRWERNSSEATRRRAPDFRLLTSAPRAAELRVRGCRSSSTLQWHSAHARSDVACGVTSRCASRLRGFVVGAVTFSLKRALLRSSVRCAPRGRRGCGGLCVGGGDGGRADGLRERSGASMASGTDAGSWSRSEAEERPLCTSLRWLRRNRASMVGGCLSVVIEFGFYSAMQSPRCFLSFSASFVGSHRVSGLSRRGRQGYVCLLRRRRRHISASIVVPKVL